MDPLHYLPYEPWLQCLTFASLGIAGGPLPYMQISTKWHDCILSSPQLWTNIVIDGGEDEENRIYTFLMLSKGQDLDLMIMMPTSLRNVAIIKANSRRIRSITLSVTICNWSSEELSHQASYLLSRLAESSLYSKIGALSIDKLLEPVIPESFFKACPVLRYLNSVTPQPDQRPKASVYEASFRNIDID